MSETSIKRSKVGVENAAGYEPAPRRSVNYRDFNAAYKAAQKRRAEDGKLVIPDGMRRKRG
jgi:hypothetical protein